MSVPAPTVLALMVCDLVVEDMRTRNKSLINTFNSIVADQVPTRHDRLFVYLQMTDGHGKVPARLELLSPNEEIILTLQGEANFSTPLAVHDIVFELRGLIFPVYGKYRFRVIAGEAGIAERPFEVVSPDRLRQRRAPPGEPE